MTEKTNILITGGLGFIGWNLAMRLYAEKEKYNVIVLDKKKFKKNFDYSKCLEEFYILDQIDTNDIIKNYTLFIMDEGMRADVPADFIFHFGEFARVEQSLKRENITDVLMSNMSGTASIINSFISDNPNAHFIYAGSSTRFSWDDAYKQSPYAFTKYANAEFIKLLSQWFGLKTSVLYFYNVFGEGENDDNSMGTVVGKFVKSWNESEKIKVFGGTQSRRFTYVGDVVNNIVSIVESVSEGRVATLPQDIHLVSTSVKETTIYDLARMIYDDERMIEFEKKKMGCRNLSIPDEELKKVFTFGQYEKTVKDYINEIKTKRTL